eukprot:7425682-Lingulodinium_polyedra.AAC.1
MGKGGNREAPQAAGRSVGGHRGKGPHHDVPDQKHLRPARQEEDKQDLIRVPCYRTYGGRKGSKAGKGDHKGAQGDRSKRARGASTSGTSRARSGQEAEQAAGKGGQPVKRLRFVKAAEQAHAQSTNACQTDAAEQTHAQSMNAGSASTAEQTRAQGMNAGSASDQGRREGEEGKGLLWKRAWRELGIERTEGPEMKRGKRLLLSMAEREARLEG